MTANSQGGISGWRLAAEEFAGEKTVETTRLYRPSPTEVSMASTSPAIQDSGLSTATALMGTQYRDDSCGVSLSAAASGSAGILIEDLLDTVARRVEARPRVEAKQEQRRAEIEKELEEK